MTAIMNSLNPLNRSADSLVRPKRADCGQGCRQGCPRSLSPAPRLTGTFIRTLATRHFFILARIAFALNVSAVSATFPLPSMFERESEFLPLPELFSEAEESLTLPLPAPALRLDPSFGRRSLAFERNEGQVNAEVKFLARGRGYTLFLTSTETVMLLNSPPRRRERSEVPDLLSSDGELGDIVLNQEMDPPGVVRMRLIGANSQPTFGAEQELLGKVNYFIGNDPAQWRTNISTFARVRYREVYPGIDLVYYGNDSGRLEYDLIVAPGADPGRITLSVEGADEVKLNASGDLILTMGGQELRWLKPKVYQDLNAERVEVASNYSVRQSGSRNEPDRQVQITFNTAAYDRSRALVIDPVLVYSTYLGGGSEDGRDFGSDIAADGDGNAYVTGRTWSSDFPTKNPIQGTFAGGYSDAFVTKFSPTGELLYSTYLGGIGHENDAGWGGAIAIDETGSAYVTGSTSSPDFPLVNALQRQLGGISDVFVAKLSPAGSRLIFSTHLGGNRGDFANAIAVDASGHAYLVGGAGEGFPTKNALYATITGGAAFVAKLNPAGDALIYSTFLGRNTGATAITVDTQGNAYVCGVAGSVPVKNAIQARHNGPANGYDGFIAKINSDGSQLLFSTYLGGRSSEYAASLAIGPDGDLYVGFGEVQSSDFPVVKPFQAKLNGKYDVAIVRMKPDGSAIVFSTYFGGQGDEGVGIALDAKGNIYFAGRTTSPDLPLVEPLEDALIGERAGFITVLQHDGQKLLFSSYFPGAIPNIALDSAGHIYLTGYTSSPDFPVANAFQPTLKSTGSFDAFVTKLSPLSAGPYLQISRSGETHLLTWPASGGAFVLESTDSLLSASWRPTPTPPVIIGDQQSVVVDIEGSARFYRLRKL